MEDAEILQERAVSEFGGTVGVKDPEGLDGAINRPQFLAKYQNPTLCECAARYGIALAQTQFFHDGNKRTGAYAVATFLRINGYRFRPPEDEFEPVMDQIATKKISEEEFRRWIVQHTEPAE